MRNFFKRRVVNTEKIQTILQGQSEAILEFLRLHGHGRRYCTIRQGPCTTKGFFFWEKNAEGLYHFANEMHCVEFFGLEAVCKDEVRGRSDMDLVNAYKERTGLRHSYGDLCEGSDAIVKNLQVPCRFIEIGYIGPRLFILDVKKTPEFNAAGEFIGTTGIAIDIAEQGNLVELIIQEGLKLGLIKTITIEGTEAAVYQVEDSCDARLFEGGFPT